MDLIRIIFEFTNPIVLNNEMTVSEFPFALDYPRGSELVVDNLSEKFILNVGAKETGNETTTHSKFEVLKITDDVFIVRGKSVVDKKLHVIHASSHFLFPRRYIVELGNDVDTTYFTIYSRQTDKIAINLGIKVENAGILMESGKIILRADNISFTYNPTANMVEEHKLHYSPGTPIPFIFLQHLKNGDFSLAKKMLGFKISDNQIKNYFGKFEMLLNNYLDDESLVSIRTKDGVRNLRFHIKGDIIENIE